MVRDHDQRSLTGRVAPVADVEAMVGELLARISGFGPLQGFLEDPEVEEIWINDPSRVFVARRGRHELTNVMLSSAQVAELVERMLKSSGRRIDLSRPFVDAMLPEGHRLHVVLEGISRGFSAVNIRNHAQRSPNTYGVEEGWGDQLGRTVCFRQAGLGCHPFVQQTPTPAGPVVPMASRPPRTWHRILRFPARFSGLV